MRLIDGLHNDAHEEVTQGEIIIETGTDVSYLFYELIREIFQS